MKRFLLSIMIMMGIISIPVHAMTLNTASADVVMADSDGEEEPVQMWSWLTQMGKKRRKKSRIANKLERRKNQGSAFSRQNHQKGA